MACHSNYTTTGVSKPQGSYAGAHTMGRGPCTQGVGDESRLGAATSHLTQRRHLKINLEVSRTTPQALGQAPGSDSRTRQEYEQGRRATWGNLGTRILLLCVCATEPCLDVL